MKKLIVKSKNILNSQAGMELVQVAILVAIAIIIGLIFKNSIVSFVNDIFDGLSSGDFKSK